MRAIRRMILCTVALLPTACGGGNEAPRTAADVSGTGVLRVLDSNPRWLTDDSGKARYFTGPTGQFAVNPNATVSTVQDSWNDDVSRVNDYATAFDTVIANGHNFVRLWRQETSAWGSRSQFASNSYWRVPPVQMPWTLVKTRIDSSTGTAVTVGVYDLASFNQSYFDRLRSVVLSAVNKGLTPSVMLFEGFENHRLSAEFSGFSHPMFAENNVNGVSCDANGDVHCEETHTLSNATVTAYQEAYIRKVVDTLNDIDGYIYEISNEPGFDTVVWQNHVAEVVSTYGSQGGRQSHPIWMSHWGTQSRQPPSNDYLYNNPHVDVVAPAGHEFETNPPHNQANRSVNVWFHDTDHGGNGDGIVSVDWPWKSLTRGVSPLLLDCPFDVCQREPDSERPLIRRAMAQTLTYANKINLKAMTVETGKSIIDSGYGLYEPCAEYLMYMPADGSHNINLSSCQPDHSFAVEFFEPLTGTTTSGETVLGGAVHGFNPPGSSPMVVHLKVTQR